MVRTLVVWVVLMLAEIVHGTLREFYLKPLIGDFRARQVAVFTGSCLLFGITCWLVRCMRAEGRLLLVGTAWVVLTVAPSGRTLRCGGAVCCRWVWWFCGCPRWWRRGCGGRIVGCDFCF